MRPRLVRDIALASAFTLTLLFVCGPLVYIVWSAEGGGYVTSLVAAGVGLAGVTGVVAVWADVLDTHWH